MGVAPPPDPFDPLLETWDVGDEIVRVHQLRYGPLDFNPSSSRGRFRPIVDSDLLVVPTMYGGGDSGVAISESLFHDLPVTPGPKHLPRSLVDLFALARLRPTRSLELVRFDGHGLRRLGTTHGNLIEAGPSDYPQTAAWGQAVYNVDTRPDGIRWASRQFPGGVALMLFGDRCGDELELIGGSVMPLAYGTGFELVCAAANNAGVVIVES